MSPEKKSNHKNFHKKQRTSTNMSYNNTFTHEVLRNTAMELKSKIFGYLDANCPETLNSRLNELKMFLDQNKDKKQKSPSSHSKDTNIRSLASFISTQEKNYKNKSQIMKEQDIYDVWTNFMEEYKESLMTQDEAWLKIFEELENFIILHKKRPNKHSSEANEKKLGEWLVKQSGNYKNKKGIMNKDIAFYEKFKIFLDKYSDIIF